MSDATATPEPNQYGPGEEPELFQRMHLPPERIPSKPTDLVFAERVIDLIDREAAAGLSELPNYDRSSTSTKRMRSLCQTIIDQAAEIERLTPRVLTEVDEINALPAEAVIRDKWGQVHERDGLHWFTIQDDTFCETIDLGTPVTVLFVPKDGAL